MFKRSNLQLLFLLLAFPLLSRATTLPDDRYTSGALCSDRDDDFDQYDYPERVARCERNVTVVEKEKIAAQYGDIPKSEWSKYEFDHYIPLCAGGSNDIKNLWPQPHGEALDKDKVESEVCRKMKAGTMTQAEAVARINDWFNKIKEQKSKRP